MRVVSITFIVAIATCSKVDAYRDNENEQHEEIISAFSEKFIRRKAFGSGLEGGDPLPPGICAGDYSEQYTIRKRLGAGQEGSFGQIWKASLKGSSQVDKILKSVKYIEGDDTDNMNFDPIELIPLRLNLAFVSRLESVFWERTKNKVWIAQPFYSGGDLHGWRPSDPSEMLAIAKQYAFGLWQIHRAGFIYSDVKPENTFWVDSKKKQLVLADFGLATPCLNGGKTCTNRFAGTPEFLSPNILSREEYGFEVDWWAFGVMLMDMVDRNCYGRYFWKGEQRHLDRKQTWSAIKEGHCKFRRDSPITKDPVWNDFHQFVEKICLKDNYEKYLKNNHARERMQSENPAHHPVLSDPYFFDVGEQETGWRTVCAQYYGTAECDFKRTPSLGSLCKGVDSQVQQANLQEDGQQTLLDNLKSARDAQTHIIEEATQRAFFEASHICGGVCSAHSWISKYKSGNKASEKMANACEFVKAKKQEKGNKFEADQCEGISGLGWNENSPRRMCCKCLASPNCQANPLCMQSVCS